MRLGAVVLTAIVRLELAEPPEGITELADKVHVTRCGHATVKLTAELKPFDGVTVIVEAPLLPFLMLSELGDADREKSGLGDATAL